MVLNRGTKGFGTSQGSALVDKEQLISRDGLSSVFHVSVTGSQSVAYIPHGVGVRVVFT